MQFEQLPEIWRSHHAVTDRCCLSVRPSSVTTINNAAIVRVKRIATPRSVSKPFSLLKGCFQRREEGILPSKVPKLQRLSVTISVSMFSHLSDSFAKPTRHPRGVDRVKLQGRGCDSARALQLNRGAPDPAVRQMMFTPPWLSSRSLADFMLLYPVHCAVFSTNLKVGKCPVLMGNTGQRLDFRFSVNQENTLPNSSRNVYIGPRIGPTCASNKFADVRLKLIWRKTLNSEGLTCHCML